MRLSAPTRSPRAALAQGVGAGEARFPQRRHQAIGLDALHEQRAGLGVLGKLGRHIGAPQRRRRIVGQRRGGEVGFGLGVAAGQGAGDAPQAPELRVVEHLGMLARQRVEHADRFEAHLGAHQKAGQRHASGDGRLAILGAALGGGGGEQPVIAAQEAALARLRPIGPDDRRHHGRLRRTQPGVLALARGPGRGEGQALGAADADDLALAPDGEVLDQRFDGQGAAHDRVAQVHDPRGAGDGRLQRGRTAGGVAADADDGRLRLRTGAERDGPGVSLRRHEDRGVGVGIDAQGGVVGALEGLHAAQRARVPGRGGDVERGGRVEDDPDGVAAAEHGRAGRIGPGEGEQGLAVRHLGVHPHHAAGGQRVGPRRLGLGYGNGFGGGFGRGRLDLLEDVDIGRAVGLADAGVGVVGEGQHYLDAAGRARARRRLDPLGRRGQQARHVGIARHGERHRLTVAAGGDAAGDFDAREGLRGGHTNVRAAARGDGLDRGCGDAGGGGDAGDAGRSHPGSEGLPEAHRYPVLAAGAAAGAAAGGA